MISKCVVNVFVYRFFVLFLLILSSSLFSYRNSFNWRLQTLRKYICHSWNTTYGTINNYTMESQEVQPFINKHRVRITSIYRHYHQIVWHEWAHKLTCVRFFIFHCLDFCLYFDFCNFPTPFCTTFTVYDKWVESEDKIGIFLYSPTVQKP